MARAGPGCGSSATTRAPRRRKEAMRSPTWAPMSKARSPALTKRRVERVHGAVADGIAVVDLRASAGPPRPCRERAPRSDPQGADLGRRLELLRDAAERVALERAPPNLGEAVTTANGIGDEIAEASAAGSRRASPARAQPSAPQTSGAEQRSAATGRARRRTRRCRARRAPARSRSPTSEQQADHEERDAEGGRRRRAGRRTRSRSPRSRGSAPAAVARDAARRVSRMSARPASFGDRYMARNVR